MYEYVDVWRSGNVVIIRTSAKIDGLSRPTRITPPTATISMVFCLRHSSF
jgi:hypothetical protein